MLGQRLFLSLVWKWHVRIENSVDRAYGAMRPWSKRSSCFGYLSKSELGHFTDTHILLNIFFF
jgi:hypothetical protein